jgi:hypothetical protein
MLKYKVVIVHKALADSYDAIPGQDGTNVDATSVRERFRHLQNFPTD